MTTSDTMSTCRECDRLLGEYRCASKAYSARTLALIADLSQFKTLLVSVGQAKLACENAKGLYDEHKLSHTPAVDELAA